MKHASLVILAFAALAGAAPALAQDANSDIRCMMVSNLFSKAAKEAKAKEVASSAALFYGGRVSAYSNAQIESGMVSQSKQINPTNASAAMNECAQAMNRALQKIQGVGQKIQASAPKPPAQPKAK